MNLILLSLLAGVLTVLSPCVLPMLPVVLGGSVGEKNKSTPYIIICSLAVSIFVFTMLLRVGTIFVDVPNQFWEILSGCIIIVVGSTMLYPSLWTVISSLLKLAEKSDAISQKGRNKNSFAKNIFLGFSLGPIFTSCSPTYGLILAAVLPSSTVKGVLYLLLYIVGLSFVLLAIGLGGKKVSNKLRWASSSDGTFKKLVAILLIIVGVLVASGLMREIEIWWASSDLNFVNFEVGLLPKN